MRDQDRRISPAIPASVLLTAALLFFGCGSVASEADGGLDGDGGTDGGDLGKATWVKPEGYATVTFFVDDTANRTYASGHMRWVGTFLYDPETNIISPDPNWGQELDVFPALFDDGPIAEGGHEMPGATAGDHIFSTAVYVQADAGQDLLFQYGAVDEDGNWIWTGPNGQFSLPAGSTGRVDAAGFFIHAFGTYDLKLELDVGALHPDLWPFDPQSGRIEIAGSMNSWRRVALADDGGLDQGGDEVAGDGVYTYRHSARLGPHDGLLYGEQRVQFVFYIDGQAYRTGDTLPAGVSAWVDCDGAFAPEDIFLEPDSLGMTQNPTVAICGGSGDLIVGPLVPPHGSTDGGQKLAVYGSGFEPGAQVRIGNRLASDVEFIGPGQITCRAPALPSGPVRVRVTNPDGSFGVLDDGYAAEAAPPLALRYIGPARGPTAGGQQVILAGEGFEAGLAVSFGGVPATAVQVSTPERAACLSPEHAAGQVTVSVSNPDGRSDSVSEGYRYSDSTDLGIDWAALVAPADLLIVESEDPPLVQARVYDAALTPAVGCSLSLRAELGVGPIDSDPTVEPERWIWLPASCRSDCPGCSGADVFQAPLPALAAGAHRFGFRFSADGGQTWLIADGGDGSLDGFQPEDLGSVRVLSADAALRIDSLDPAGASVLGGTGITVHGAGFSPGCTVLVGGEAVPAELIDDSQLRFEAPAHPAGRADLVLIRQDPTYAEMACPGGLPYWPLHTPDLDGQIAADWPSSLLVSHNEVASDWGDNRLRDLYLAFDDQFLYLAIAGWVDDSVGNALVVYLDRDFGPASGVVDMNSLVDRTAPDGSAGLDDAISSICRVVGPGFGAEFAIGTQGMAAVGADEDAPEVMARAGLRALSDPMSFAQAPATVLTSGGPDGPAAVEMAIPWTSLFPAGRPPWPMRMALAVRLVSADGLGLARASLPEDDPAQPALIERVLVFDLP